MSVAEAAHVTSIHTSKSPPAGGSAWARDTHEAQCTCGRHGPNYMGYRGPAERDARQHTIDTNGAA